MILRGPRFNCRGPFHLTARRRLLRTPTETKIARVGMADPPQPKARPMPVLWPLLILIPPLAISLRGGRSAWLWLSLMLGAVVLWILGFYAVYQFEKGNVGLALWLLSTDADGNSSDETSYVIVATSSLIGAMVPSLIVGLLLLIPAHPRRARVDIVVFWAIVACLLVAGYGVLFAVRGLGLSVEAGLATGIYSAALMATAGLNILAVLLWIYAALRPLASWWRARKGA